MLSSKSYANFLTWVFFVAAAVAGLVAVCWGFSGIWNGIMPLFKLPPLTVIQAGHLLLVVWLLRFISGIGNRGNKNA